MSIFYSSLAISSAKIFATQQDQSHNFESSITNSVLRLENMDENDMNGRSNGLNGHSHMLHLHGSDAISRSTSPGVGWDGSESKADMQKRYRPRTFPYFKLLPYAVEEEAERDRALREILKQLYIAIKAEDFSPGAVHWTRELKGWLQLKFEITRELRVKLVKLYYMLSMAPGLDPSTAERFSTMFLVLTK